MNAVPSPVTGKRLEYLDSIRGLAALAVLIGHTVAAFEWPDYLVSWRLVPGLNAMTDGTAAVGMFFVLSGFVLALPYVRPESKRLGSPSILAGFYVRRFTRIWIPWACAWVLSLVAKTYFFPGGVTVPAQTDWLLQFWAIPVDAASAIRQAIFTLKNPSELLIPQDWSLRVELHASIVLPLLVLVAVRSVALLLLICAVVFAAFGSGPYYCAFIIGVLAARYHAATTGAEVRRVTRAVAIFGTGFALYQSRLLLSLWAPSLASERLIWGLTSVGCVLMLMVAVKSSRIQRILSWRPIADLGRISYSVYLLQFIVILCVLPPALSLLNRWEVPVLAAFFAILLLSISVTIALSYVTFRAIEMPCIRLGRSISGALQTGFQGRTARVAKDAE